MGPVPLAPAQSGLASAPNGKSPSLRASRTSTRSGGAVIWRRRSQAEPGLTAATADPPCDRRWTAQVAPAVGVLSALEDLAYMLYYNLKMRQWGSQNQ